MSGRLVARVAGVHNDHGASGPDERQGPGEAGEATSHDHNIDHRLRIRRSIGAPGDILHGSLLLGWCPKSPTRMRLILIPASNPYGESVGVQITLTDVVEGSTIYRYQYFYFFLSK
jgi:hypothetical protein